MSKFGKLLSMMFGAVCVGAMTLGANAIMPAQSGLSDKVERVTVKQSDQHRHAVATYPVCNMNAIASDLATGNNPANKEFIVASMVDPAANYHFFVALEDGDLNVDRIKKSVCTHIMKNQCIVFWGNVINQAMFADKPTASFPADTTPHYVLSPDISCNAIV